MVSADLNSLLESSSIRYQGKIPALSISGIAIDSRQVKPGDLFVALVGRETDGHNFIQDALKKGAVAVIGTRSSIGGSTPYLQVEDGRRALAYISAAFYGFPARKLTVIGVTGTDGKTTTSNLIYQILQTAGLQTGMISTVNALIGDRVLDTGFHVTTPEAPDVQRYLAEMVDEGLSHVVIEATSHGLDQQRVAGCEFDLAVATNVTHEHLDYHGTYENYLQAKGKLFTSLADTAPKGNGIPVTAVLNKDDSSFDYLSALIRNLGVGIKIISYGIQTAADLFAEDIEIKTDGLRFTAVSAGERMDINSTLSGKYNVSNCLAAVSATVMGIELDARFAVQGVASMKSIPGRMEAINLGQDFLAIVDFAHTPNALSNALQTARQLTQGKVIVIFGSAGLRDREKRRLMAEVSAKLADVTVLTAEDPRTEPLDGILEEMAAGIISAGGKEGGNFWRIPDRGNAIKFAVKMANPGDVVLACGKGHEQSMCFGDIEYPWDDRTAMTAALSELLSIPGPNIPYLPTRNVENKSF